MGDKLVSVDDTTYLFPSMVMDQLDIRYQTYMSAGAAGVAGDGVTDDSGALNSLLASAATFGAGVRLDPLSTVRVAANPITIPSNTRLDLNGATIKSALPNVGSRLLLVANASNVVIENGVLNGDKAAFAAATEQRHNVHITGSTNVAIRDVRSVGAKGDGIYVGDQNGISQDIYLENVTCDQNWRQGLSISHVSGFTAIGCDFTNTAGTNPQAGVDIEPNSPNVACENIKFFGCRFLGNSHFGFLVAMAAVPVAKQGDITLVGCAISDNGVANDGQGGGLRLVGARDFTMLGGSITDNIGPGVLNDGTPQPERLSSNVNLMSVTIEGSSTHGVSITQPIQSLTIQSCVIRNNSKGSTAVYDGINVSPAAAMTGPTLINNVITGTSQRYGVLTTANVTGLQLLLNSISGNGTADLQLGDAVDTRFRLDGGVGNFIGGRVFLYGASGSSNPLLSIRQTGDTTDRVNLLPDGRLTWSSGAASSDAILSRPAAGVIGVTTGSGFRLPAGATGSRPSASAVGASTAWLDTTTHKLQISDGTAWRDSAGTVVP